MRHFSLVANKASIIPGIHGLTVNKAETLPGIMITSELNEAQAFKLADEIIYMLEDETLVRMYKNIKKYLEFKHKV